MSQHDAEQRLVDLLHHRAEDAMNNTDTRIEHEKLVYGAESARPDRRPWLVAAAATAAVAAVVVAVLAGPSSPDRATPEPGPAEEPGPSQVDAVVAATGFVDAFVAGDADALPSYLAPGVEPWTGWRLQIRRNQDAWGVAHVLEPCRVVDEIRTGTLVRCPYSMHLLRSEAAGLGPFGDNAFVILVDQQGEIASADNEITWTTNGIKDYINTVRDWLRVQHPDDFDFLTQDEATLSEDDWPRWSRLWERYSLEYVTRDAE